MMNAERKAAAQAVNIRQSDKPPVMPACKNCQHHAYEAGDRMGAKGEYIEKTGRRCVNLQIRVTTRLVCDLHAFKHADRRDV